MRSSSLWSGYAPAESRQDHRRRSADDGHVLGCAHRWPSTLSHLVRPEPGGDRWWVAHSAPELLASGGDSAGAVQAARRLDSGQVTPRNDFPTLMRLFKAYNEVLPPIWHFLAAAH